MLKLNLCLFLVSSKTFDQLGGDGTCLQSRSSLYAEYSKLRRAPETPGGLLSPEDILILVSIWSLARGYENMNDNLF